MMEPYVSICIPTNGRIEILKNTLDSIYKNDDVNLVDYEVIISDNSTNDDLLNLLESYKSISNLKYFKTKSEGFLNSINALKMAKGSFLKLHNNYTIFNENCLKHFISFVKKENEQKPLVFFTNGVLKCNGIERYHDFNSFIFDLSYWNTWSTGFSIWKQDFEKIHQQNLNKMFPHTSLMLLQSAKLSYTINNNIFFTNQPIPEKGGYNLFRTFSVEYLKMIEDLKDEGRIKSKTFNKIKQDLFFRFLVEWYVNTKIQKNNFSYDLRFIRENISVNYSILHYYLMISLAYLKYFKGILINIFSIKK